MKLTLTSLGLCATAFAQLKAPFALDKGHVLFTARDGTQISACLISAKIQFSDSTSPTFTNDTLAWNSRIAPKPEVVVFPTSEAEVTAALLCARKARVKVTTLGGNRSFLSAGFGRNDGAMIVNLKNMRVLKYDEGTKILTYGGPVTISEAASFAWLKHSRALPHGRCPDVGMTGIALGGGFGTLSRKTGTVLDNILSARVVLANGSIVTASETDNPDLFWAIRGAGSSFGVVLSMDIRTLDPVEKVISYTIIFPREVGSPTPEMNVQALLGAQNWALKDANDDDKLSIRVKLDDKVSIRGFFYGTEADFKPVSSSLLSHLPNMTVTYDVSSFWDSEEATTPGIQTNGITERRYFWIGSITVPNSAPLDEKTARALFDKTVYAANTFLKDSADTKASGFVDVWGGRYTAGVKPDATAWKHDNNLLLVRWDIRTGSAETAYSIGASKGVRTSFYEFVQTYVDAKGKPGGFPNYRDSEWTLQDMPKYLYGDNWSKLLKLKALYDPDQMFNSDPQAIPLA